MTTSQNESDGTVRPMSQAPAGSPSIPAPRQGSRRPVAVPATRPRLGHLATNASVMAVAGLAAVVLLVGPALSSEPTTTNGNAGDTLTVGDLEMTASAVTPGASMVGPTLCSTVTYRNTGSAPESIDAMAEWTLRDASGASEASGLFGTDSALSAGQLAGGRTISGDVCFDRTAIGSGRYVVQFTLRGFSSARAAWTDRVG